MLKLQVFLKEDPKFEYLLCVVLSRSETILHFCNDLLLLVAAVFLNDLQHDPPR